MSLDDDNDVSGRVAIAALRAVLAEAESDPALASELLTRLLATPAPSPRAAVEAALAAEGLKRKKASVQVTTNSHLNTRKSPTGDSSGKVLVEALVAKSGSMAGAARAAGVSVDSVRAWVSGKAAIRADRIAMVQKALDELEVAPAPGPEVAETTTPFRRAAV